MSNHKKTKIEIQDVLNSIKKYGKDDILAADINVFRDNNNEDKNKNNARGKATKQIKFDCTWVPFQLKLENGKISPLKNLKIAKVIISSAAKLPHSTTEETAKNLLILFREVSEEELMSGGDYAPKKMETDEEQVKENARALTKVKEYIENTRKLCQALEAIDASYKKWASILKQTPDLGFTLNKDSNSVKQVKDNFRGAKITKEEMELEKNKVVTVYSIRQSSYEDKETKEEIELKFPLTRIKLMVSKDGQIGTELYDYDKGRHVFTPNVYNSRKLDSNGNPTLAKVKVNGKSSLLTVKTAGSFISFRSLISGTIEFGEIVISKFGISLANKFKVIYVKRHKASLVEPLFSPDEFKEMRGSASESEEDVIINNEEDPSDLEDNVDDGEEKYEEEEIKPKNKKIHVKVEKSTKSNKKSIKVKKESDDEGTSGTRAVCDSDDESQIGTKPKKISSKLSKKPIKVKKESEDEVEAVYASDAEDKLISDED